MIKHWFGGKHELFLAALRPDPETPARIRAAVDGPTNTIGQRIVATALDLGDRHLDPLLDLLTSVESRPDAVRGTSEWLRTVVADELGRHIPGLDRPQLRAALVVAHLAGLGLFRTTLGRTPLCSIPLPTLVATLAPIIQHYVLGPLPLVDEPPGPSDRRRDWFDTPSPTRGKDQS